jgi:hypothetical protein
VDGLFFALLTVIVEQFGVAREKLVAFEAERPGVGFESSIVGSISRSP